MEATASVRSRAWTVGVGGAGAGASARGGMMRARRAGRAPRRNLNQARRRAVLFYASARPRSASTVLNRDAWSFFRRVALDSSVWYGASPSSATPRSALASLSSKLLRGRAVGVRRVQRFGLALDERLEPQDRRALLLEALPYGFGGRGQVELRRRSAAPGRPWTRRPRARRRALLI